MDPYEDIKKRMLPPVIDEDKKKLQTIIFVLDEKEDVKKLGKKVYDNLVCELCKS